MSIVSVLIWLAASVGNAVLLVPALNWIYAQPWDKYLLKLMRALSGLAIVAWPAYLAWVGGFGLTETLIGWLHFDWHLPLGLYGLLCVAFGLVVFPWVTIQRLRRPRPAALLSNHTQIMDVHKELGYRPAGRGKYLPLMYLPFNEVYEVEFSVRTYQLPRLPAAWDGLSILHLSDLHFCGTPDRAFYDHVMDRCRDWDPDLVAFTGDLLDNDRLCRWIVPVLSRLRWRDGAFAILGNHDWYHQPWMARRRLRRAGFHVVGNGWTETQVRGERLIVIGHEGPWFTPEPTLDGCPVGPFRLCLSHTPDHVPWARANGIDLMLSGHNHGGQVRFPLIGSVFVPSRWSRKYDFGSFHEAPTLLHVSRGLAGKQPLRFRCRPEVTKIVLRAGTGPAT